MGWIRLSDDFYDNEKIVAVGALGVALWVAGIGYCNRNRTDGLIPKSKAKGLIDYSGLSIDLSMHAVGNGLITALHEYDTETWAIKSLITEGIWHESGHSCGECVDPGRRSYVVHDYLDFQPSREELEAKAEASKARVARWREAQCDKQNGNAVTNGKRTPEVQTPQTQSQSLLKDMHIDKPMCDNDAEFEIWWQHYPLKKAKGQAKVAYRKARKKTDLGTLTAAVHAYAKLVADVDRKFIAYGSTWLNGERWLDEDIAPVTADALTDWLRNCWNNHDTGSIADRTGLEYPLPDIPDDVTDAKAYVQQDRRNWISHNHDHILELILKREAVNA